MIYHISIIMAWETLTLFSNIRYYMIVSFFIFNYEYNNNTSHYKKIYIFLYPNSFSAYAFVRSLNRN